MATTKPHVKNSSLLAALPPKDYSSMVDDLESVNLTSGQVLYEQGGRLTHAYFPAESLISLVTSVQGDRVLEAAVVGHEGMVGVAWVQVLRNRCSGPSCRPPVVR